jgi:hypothetical protein
VFANNFVSIEASNNTKEFMGIDKVPAILGQESNFVFTEPVSRLIGIEVKVKAAKPSMELVKLLNVSQQSQ